MDWIILVIAGVLEVGWAIGLKYTQGFTKVWPTILTIAGMTLSMVLLSVAVKRLPIGTAYAIWTGIGAVGVAIAGIFLFGESRDPLRVFFIALIVIGIIGLKILSPK